MSKGDLVTQETFDLLLDWLDDNRREAGQKYERIRRLLIRLFVNRGCFEAEELADETINRVTLKLPSIIEGYAGEPKLYFYAVANKVHHEWMKRQKRMQDNAPVLETVKRREAEYECLENCLNHLSAEQRDLIIEYYQVEKGTKIELRRSLADRMNVSTDILQVRTHRLRIRLLKCVKTCAEKKI